MKKLIYTIIIIVIQLSTLGIQHLAAQAPNDNIGSGNALSFDGTNDYVNVPNISAYDFGSGDFTAQVWAYYDDLSGYTSPISTFNANQSTVGYVVSIQADAKIYYFLGCGASASPCNGNAFGISTPYTITSGTWHHITILKRGTNMELYDNGVLAASAVAPVSVRTQTNGQDIKIGRRYHDNTCCNHDGKIDDVRIWNRALSQTEIRDSMSKKLTGSESGLVGYWNMNEGAGGTITDQTTYNNSGVLN